MKQVKHMPVEIVRKHILNQYHEIWRLRQMVTDPIPDDTNVLQQIDNIHLQLSLLEEQVGKYELFENEGSKL